MRAAIYTPKEFGNRRTNYLRTGRLWPNKKEAAQSVEAHVPGAVIVEGCLSSLGMEIALPELSELAGFEVKPTLSCGCAAIESCRHRNVISGCGCLNPNLCDHGKVPPPALFGQQEVRLEPAPPLA